MRPFEKTFRQRLLHPKPASRNFLIKDLFEGPLAKTSPTHPYPLRTVHFFQSGGFSTTHIEDLSQPGIRLYPVSQGGAAGRIQYTAEFKKLAVKQVKAGQNTGSVARELSLIEQTLRNWVKAADAGKLNGAGSKAVTPEQMELSRLRADIISAMSWMREHNARATCRKKPF